ncbi:MAG: WYL domain-containing protein [Elusimicrobia bacterium]|nr:WYL domain-containing protein [Elusimicrobiota bacterium]
MNKMSAVIFILNKLDSGSVTEKGLAEELNISTDAIRDYLKEIETAEFPLYNPEKGTYAFAEEFSLKKRQLSGTDAGLLVLFNSFVESLNNKKFDESLANLRKKILQENEDSPFYVKIQKGQEYEVNGTTKIIETAIRERYFISIESNKKNTIKCLRPIKIAYYEGFWYLICLLGKKNKILKYNIANIKSVAVSDKQFEYTKDIDDILKESVSIWFEKDRNMKVKLSVDKKVAKYFKIRQFFPLQETVEEQEDGTLILECKVSRKEEVLPTVFQWLPYIKVLEPKLIDKKVKEIISKYINE